MVTGQTFMIKNNSFILTKKNYALVLIVRKKYVYQLYQGPKMSQSQIMICEYSMQKVKQSLCVNAVHVFFLFLSTEYTIEDLS